MLYASRCSEVCCCCLPLHLSLGLRMYHVFISLFEKKKKKNHSSILTTCLLDIMSTPWPVSSVCCHILFLFFSLNKLNVPCDYCLSVSCYVPLDIHVLSLRVNRPCVHSLYCVTFSSYLLFISYVHRFVYYALILICCFKQQCIS